MKYNLQDVAFLLVARFDTIARLENALCVSLTSCAFPYGHDGDEGNTDTDDTVIF